MKEAYRIIDHPLVFKRPSGTSRGILTQKGSVFIISTLQQQIVGIGEVSTIAGLSPEYNEDIPQLIRNKMEGYDVPKYTPAVDFGLEMWRRSIECQGVFDFFDTPYSRGERAIPINGLIWMGSKANMLEQIAQKLKAGYRCLKLKIGAIDFEEELSIIHHIRQEYHHSDVELRLDANGAFEMKDASVKLAQLADYDIHSIEQPIRHGQWEAMAALCADTPIPIALDEELIGIRDTTTKQKLLEVIKPQYIILKPSLLGGWKASEEWIRIANDYHVGWWITSALESNIGLHAIAAWTDTLGSILPQGLGTGSLFVNNIHAPLEIRDAALWYHPDKPWDLSQLSS